MLGTPTSAAVGIGLSGSTKVGTGTAGPGKTSGISFLPKSRLVWKAASLVGISASTSLWRYLVKDLECNSELPRRNGRVDLGPSMTPRPHTSSRSLRNHFSCLCKERVTSWRIWFSCSNRSFSPCVRDKSSRRLWLSRSNCAFSSCNSCLCFLWRRSNFLALLCSSTRSSRALSKLHLSPSFTISLLKT